MSQSRAPSAAQKEKEPARLTPILILVMAVTCGFAVASIYYNQPILALLVTGFKTSSAAVSLVPTVTQIGYAAGLLFLTPLGRHSGLPVRSV